MTATKTILIVGGLGLLAYVVYTYAKGQQQNPAAQIITASGNALGAVIGAFTGKGKDSSSVGDTASSAGDGEDGAVTIARNSPAGVLDTATTSWTSNGDAAIADGTYQARLSGRQLQPTAYMTDAQHTQLSAHFPVS